jgi:MFS family permease
VNTARSRIIASPCSWRVGHTDAVLRRLSSIAVDTRALRESRDFRLLTLGSIVTGFGTQAALVALPYQVYVTTGSAFLTGLLGLVELGPLIVLSLFGGALADRFDRRRLLLAMQIALVAVATALAAAALAGSPPLWLLYVLAAASTAASAVERVSRSAIVPNVVSQERLRGALSLTFGLYQLTMVVGPAAGGLLIAAAGVEGAYIADAVTCAGMAVAAYAMSPQPPLHEHDEREPILRSIATGLRFVRGEHALMGSFAVDLAAMTFGMPRALFPVLSVTVYHAGASGTGALFAAVAAGATVAALTTGWLEHARWLGRIVLAAIVVWGVAIALAGVTTSLVVAIVLLAVAGAADSVSAVCRSTITQTLTPDRLRGRMSSVYGLVVASGPRLGDIESGAVASLASPRASVVSGGVACVVSVGLIAAAFPALARYDGDEARAAAAATAAAR